MSCWALDVCANKRIANSVPQGRLKVAQDVSLLVLSCFGCFFVTLPQKRHPERSASQIYRVPLRLVARSRRTPTVLILPMLLLAFRPRPPRM